MQFSLYKITYFHVVSIELLFCQDINFVKFNKYLDILKLYL